MKRQSRRKNPVDWRAEHADHVLSWTNRYQQDVDDGEPYDQGVFDQYLQWLHRSTRLHIKPPYYEATAEDESDDDEDPYDATTRASTQPDRAPLHSYVVIYHVLQLLFVFLYLVHLPPGLVSAGVAAVSVLRRGSAAYTPHQLYWGPRPGTGFSAGIITHSNCTCKF